MKPAASAAASRTDSSGSEKCRAELCQAVRHVPDCREDPVSRVYEEFYTEQSHRTCGKCGHVTPRPAA